MTIRKESPADIDAITHVTIEAFKDVEVSNQTEHYIVEGLRDHGELTISLVAEIDGRVVGHIALSPVTISDDTKNWYGLGPISVLPELQNQGIGKALMLEGLAELKKLGAAGCALVGDPGYYNRFGFKQQTGLKHHGVPDEVFLVQSFDGTMPSGEVEFYEAFRAGKKEDK